MFGAPVQIYACAWWYIGTVNHPNSVAALQGVPFDQPDLAEMLFDEQPLNERPASWIFFYSGLQTKHLWTRTVSIGKQYLFSFYWSASTLSTNSLVGMATPKNAPEVWFAIVCMLTTMTFYAFVMGEISNLVMSSDAALVRERDKVNSVCGFIQQHRLPEDIARDVITAFYDESTKTDTSLDVFRALSPSLQREVAMHVSLHLIKGCDVFSQCSIGYTASLAVIMRCASCPCTRAYAVYRLAFCSQPRHQCREKVVPSDEVIFMVNSACTELFIIGSGIVHVSSAEEDEDSDVNTFSRGDVLGEVCLAARLPLPVHSCAGGQRSA